MERLATRTFALHRGGGREQQQADVIELTRFLAGVTAGGGSADQPPRHRWREQHQCVRSSRITLPPFITNLTRASSVMSASGSPATATMSANLPLSMEPM